MGMEGREESLKAFRMVSLNDMPDSEPEICIAKDSLPGENSFVWPQLRVCTVVVPADECEL
jgi:hypothetical protein